MPKSLLQEIVFTVLMVFVMVYAMICYNIALNIGGMTNEVFLMAFEELIIMAPIAFVLDLCLVGFLAKRITFSIFNPQRDNPFFIVLGISSVSVLFMCPLMSLFATLLFKDAGSQFVAVWFQTTALNFPMALCWQLFVAGPVVRKLFALLLKAYNAVTAKLRRGRGDNAPVAEGVGQIAEEQMTIEEVASQGGALYAEESPKGGAERTL